MKKIDCGDGLDQTAEKVWVHTCTCTCVDNRRVTLGVWEAEGFWHKREGGHLSSGKKDWGRVEVKEREKWGEVVRSSLHHSRCLLFYQCQPHSDWPLSRLHFSHARAALPHTQAVLPLQQGPPETFVPFISTTNTYRCSGKEDMEKERTVEYMLPPEKLLI